jgi:GNAT superfamily N-acetyltransferase
MTAGIAADRFDLPDLVEISDLLLRHGTFRFRVAGWSMYPALRKGDRMTVEPVRPSQLRIGDLIVFHLRGRLICHRLVALEGAEPELRIITKGDATSGCDEPLQPEQVLGRVVAVTRRWPWARAGGWAGAQAMRIDRGRERLAYRVALGLRWFQGLRPYRWLMRALVSRCFDYSIGIPEGRRWYRYHPISRRGSDPIGFTGHRDFHLLAKLGGTSVGSLQGKAGAEGYRIESLHVRIRYRGLGVGSHLLALAAAAARRSRPPVLLASVEPANTAAVHLFTKMGFCKTGGLHGNEVSLRRDF